MDKEPTAYYNWLKTLTQYSIHYFLEGGQAVNLWALRFINCNSQLQQYLPFTSKDCDIWIDSDAYKKINQILDAIFIKGTSPADGQLGVIKSYDNELAMDLLSNVFGLKNNELKSAEKRHFDIEGVKIIDPLYLFKGKCHNLKNLNQDNRNDKKHLLMLSIIIPEYLKSVLEALNSGLTNNPKNLKNEIKLLLRFKKDQFVRQAMTDLGLNFSELIPLKEIYACDNKDIKKYADGSLKRLYSH